MRHMSILIVVSNLKFIRAVLQGGKKPKAEARSPWK